MLRLRWNMTNFVSLRQAQFPDPLNCGPNRLMPEFILKKPEISGACPAG
jgi:hypothetical protein